MALGAIAAAVGVSTGLGLAAREDQKRAARVQRQMNRLQTAANKRKIAMQLGVASSSAIAAAAVTGTAGSSRTQQAIGSAANQAGQNLYVQDRMLSLGAKASQYLQRAADYQFYSDVFSNVASAVPTGG